MAAGTFRYTARTIEGRSVSGSMQASDTAGVLDLLRSRALFVTSVDRESEIAERLRRAFRVGGISQTALLGFFRSFVTLIRAGVSIQRSLDVTIERAADPRLLEALRSILADVESGSSLSEAMSRRPRDFAPLYVAMIRAGESGGILDDVLERLALLLERDSALRKSLRTALAYPIIVLIAAGALVVFLIAKIVPMFAQMFDSFHVELPLATKLLLGLGQLSAGPMPWLLMAATLPLSAVAVYRFSFTRAGASFIDRLRLSLPIIGPLLHKIIMARTSRMLATLLRSGVELMSAIEAIIPVTGSILYAETFARVNVALREGEPLSRPLAEAGFFDPLFLALVSVGEETGLVDDMLLKVAQYFESDVESAIATLGAMIEPALIIVLGGIVGFIVFSIFLPLYSLTASVGQ